MKTDIKPYCKEWFELRKDHIGSTDACIINGTNRFNKNSALKLYRLKKGMIEEEKANEKMIEGKELEEEAILAFEDEYGVKLEQFTYVDGYKMATLDGEFDNKSCVEIKCGEKAYQEAENDIIQDYVYTQIQHALAVSNKQLCYNIYYRFGEKMIVKEIERDDEFIKELMKLEEKFYECLKNNIAPREFHFDKEWYDDEIFNGMAEIYIHHKKSAKEQEEIAEEYKKQLISLCKGENSYNPKNNMVIKKTKSFFVYDVAKIIKKFNIKLDELDDCKSERKGFYKITY